MIKMPKPVKEILRVLKEKGYEGYTAGACVRDSILGEKPLDWDVVTNADLDALREIFPEAKVLSEKLSVIRLYDEGEDEIITDISTYRKKSADGGTEFASDIKDDMLSPFTFCRSRRVFRPSGRCPICGFRWCSCCFEAMLRHVG